MTLCLCIRSDFEVWSEQIIQRNTNVIIAKQRGYDLFFKLFFFCFFLQWVCFKKTKQLEVESLLAHVLAYDRQTLLDALRRGWGGCSEGSGSLIPSSSGGKGWSGKAGGDELSHTSSTLCAAPQ